MNRLKMEFREKTTATLLIAIFILSAFAVAIPVSAQVYEDFATHELIQVHEWPIEPLPVGDGLAIAVWYEDGFAYFEVTIPECYLPAETSHPGFTFDVDADGFADFQIMYGPDWKYMEADETGWITPASDVPEEFITSHELGTRVFTFGVPISVLGGYGSTYKFGIQAQRYADYDDGEGNIYPDASRNIYISTEPGWLWTTTMPGVLYHLSDYYVEMLIPEDTSLSGDIDLETYLTLTANPSEGGLITPDIPSPYYLYAEDTFDTVILTYTAATDYVFDHWDVDGTQSSEESVTVDMNENHDVTAFFTFVPLISIDVTSDVTFDAIAGTSVNPGSNPITVTNMGNVPALITASIPGSTDGDNFFRTYLQLGGYHEPDWSFGELGLDEPLVLTTNLDLTDFHEHGSYSSTLVFWAEAP